MGKIFLLHATPYDPGTAGEVAVRYSTGRPGGGAPVYDSVLWKNRLLVPINAEVTVFDGDFTGGTPTFGVAQIALEGGEGDPLLEYYWDGRDVTVYRGEETAAIGAFTTIFKGTVKSVSWTRDVLTLNLADYSERTQKAVQQTQYAGTGAAEGGDDLKGRPKPLAFGAAMNVEPVLVNSTYLVYQYHARSSQAVNAAFDGAVALTPGLDYASYATLIAATVTLGGYATCIAEGLVRLAAPVDKVLTLDVEGDDVGGYVETAADIMERVAVDFTDLVSGDIDTAAFAALNTANSAACALYIDANQSPAANEVFNRLMLTVGAVWTITPAGKLTVRQLAFSTSAYTFKNWRVLENVERQMTEPPYWRRRLAYAVAWRVQSENEIAAGAGVVGIGVKANFLNFTNAEPLRAYLHGFDGTGLATDTDGVFAYGGGLFTVDRSQLADGSSIRTSQAADGFIVYDTDPLAVVVEDHFADSAGTQLSAHVPDTTGTTWTEILPSAASNADIVTSGYLAPDANNTTGQKMVYSVDPAPSGSDMSTEIKVDVWPSSSTAVAWLLTRVAVSGTCYGLSFRPSATAGLAVLAICRLPNASSGTVLLTVSVPKTDGMKIRFTALGTTLYAYYQAAGSATWVLAGSVVDTNISGGKGGLGFGEVMNTGTQDISTAWRLTDFRCTEPGASFTVNGEAVNAAFFNWSGSVWRYDNGAGWTTKTASASMIVIGTLSASASTILAAKIVVPQPLGAGGTTIDPAARVDFVRQRQRFVTESDTAVQTKHKLAREAEAPGLMALEADADTENARQFALLSVYRHKYKMPCPRSVWDAAGLKIGDTVTLMIPRFGLDAGVDFIVIGFASGADADELVLTLWG